MSSEMEGFEESLALNSMMADAEHRAARARRVISGFSLLMAPAFAVGTHHFESPMLAVALCASSFACHIIFENMAEGCELDSFSAEANILYYQAQLDDDIG